MAILQTMVKPVRPRLVKPKKVFPPGSPRLGKSDYKNIILKASVSERQEEGIWIYDVVAKTSAHSTKGGVRKRIYYFAGGGWQMPPSGQHWKLCAEIAKQVPGSVVSVVSYPLAPKSAAPAALPQLLQLYDTVLRKATDENESVTFAGDSSGGNIALSLVLTALAKNESALCPESILAVSPAVDLKTHDPIVQTVNKFDPVLTLDFINERARTWTGDGDPSDPGISPLYADVSLLAKRGIKVYGVTGGYDVLTPDAILFGRKCQEAGVQGEWLNWDKQMHCFPLAWIYGLPEAKEGKNWIMNVLNGQEGAAALPGRAKTGGALTFMMGN